MKRLHIHTCVENIDQSVRFYSALFGAEPVKVKPGYAKWMLEDPRINFAISTQPGKAGVQHLGIQVDGADELAALREGMRRSALPVEDEGETVCCYARSDKSWVQDPAGVEWEIYRTMEDVDLYMQDKAAPSACGDEASGCAPGSCG